MYLCIYRDSPSVCMSVCPLRARESAAPSAPLDPAGLSYIYIYIYIYIHIHTYTYTYTYTFTYTYIYIYRERERVILRRAERAADESVLVHREVDHVGLREELDLRAGDVFLGA